MGVVTDANVDADVVIDINSESFSLALLCSPFRGSKSSPSGLFWAGTSKDIPLSFGILLGVSELLKSRFSYFVQPAWVGLGILLIVNFLTGCKKSSIGIKKE